MLLVTAYWRTNLTLRQLAPLVGISKSSADRIVGHIGPLLALKQRQRFHAGTVLIVDGTLVPTRDHSIAKQSKNYRYSTNHQVVVDADTQVVVAVGRPVPGNRNDCKAGQNRVRRQPSAGPRPSPTAANRALAWWSRIVGPRAANCADGSMSTTAPTNRSGLV